MHRTRIGAIDNSTPISRNIGVTSISSNYIDFPYTNPNTLTYSLAKYGLDSEGNAQGTILGFSLGGLYGQKYSKSGLATTADGNGTISLPMSNPTFFTSVNWGSQGDNYIYIVLGYFKPPTTGTYSFWTSSDDGSAVWIGDPALDGNSTAGQAVVNNNFGGSQGNTKRGGSTSLTADTFYPIRILTTEGGGGDNLTFSWAGPSISETTDLTQYYYYFEDGSNFATSSSASVVGYTDTSEDPPLIGYNTTVPSGFTTNKSFTTVKKIESPSLLPVHHLTMSFGEFVDTGGGSGGGSSNTVTVSTLKQVWY